MSNTSTLRKSNVALEVDLMLAKEELEVAREKKNIWEIWDCMARIVDIESQLRWR